MGNDNIGQITVAASTLNRFYYLKDHLSDVKMIVNSSGVKDSWNDYYPFGMQMDLRNGSASADVRYKYISVEQDNETGYLATGQRWYDPRIGRMNRPDRFDFLSPDINPYNYSFNNPIRFSDASDDTTINGEIWISPITAWGTRSSSGGVNTGGNGGASGGNSNSTNSSSSGGNKVPEVRLPNQNIKNNAYKGLVNFRKGSSWAATVLKELAEHNPELAALLKNIDFYKYGNAMTALALSINSFRLIDDPLYSVGEWTYDEGSVSLAWSLGGLPGIATGVLLSYGKGCYQYYAPLFQEMEANHEKYFDGK